MRVEPGSIGFDIDGVVADTTEAFIRVLGEKYGISGISAADIVEFDVAQCLDIEPEIVEGTFAVLLADPLAAGMRPLPGAVSVLQRLGRLAPLTFITARPRRRPIADWLSHILGRETFQRCSLIAMGDHDDKVRHIRQAGLDYFVDDRCETCLELEAQEDITPLVFSQPWNRGCHQLHSVSSWLEIAELCHL
ncbi:5' nucleotidase, NT5C type [Desulfobacterota bacterium M19]